jgi:endonuclease III
MVSADVRRIRTAISGGGLEATRAKHLQRVVQILKAQFGTASLRQLRKWSNPKCLEFLTSLPGVGKKSALCVMMYGLNRKVFPADAHCIRILTRLGVLPEGLEHRPAQIQLLKKVPGEYAYSLHVNLVAHGQTICRARNPRCCSCPVRLFCVSYRNRRREVWEKDDKSPTAVELFSGVGGSSRGLRNAGYRVLAALDNDEWAIRTLRLNHPEMPSENALAEDIRKPATFLKLKRLIRGQNIDVVIGGPPCQGFSMIGERIRGRNGERFIDKPGNKLYREFVHYVNRIRPNLVVMENVPKRQRLDQIGMARQNFPNLTRDRSVASEVWGYEDAIRAESFSSNGRHRRPYSKLPYFIRSGADNRAATTPSDNDRLAPQLRIVPLFDRRVKRIHIDMNDLANRHQPSSCSRPQASASVC